MYIRALLYSNYVFSETELSRKNVFCFVLSRLKEPKMVVIYPNSLFIISTSKYDINTNNNNNTTIKSLLYQ